MKLPKNSVLWQFKGYSRSIAAGAARRVATGSISLASPQSGKQAHSTAAPYQIKASALIWRGRRGRGYRAAALLRGCDVEQARSDDAAHVAGKTIELDSCLPSRELCEAFSELYCRRALTRSPAFLFGAYSCSRNRIRIAAASARVALPCGTSVVAVRPVMRPSALAHRMASFAHALMLSASV